LTTKSTAERLLLGDVEGSTRGWETDPKTIETAIVELNDVVDELVGRFDGVRPVEQGEGDSFVAAFARAHDGIGCALALQRRTRSCQHAPRTGAGCGPRHGSLGTDGQEP